MTAVDINPQPHHRGGRFIQSDALTFPLEGYDFMWASPPCQKWTALRHVVGGREYPDLLTPIRERLQAQGAPWCIENVPGAPLGGPHPLLLLCGTMFGLQTPDGRAEIRRHRWFETSWPIALRPACQHGQYGGESPSVTGNGLGLGGKARWAERVSTLTITGEHPRDDAAQRERRKVLCVAGGKAMSGGMTPPQGTRRAMSITGNTAQTNVVRNQVRETYSVADARAAMGIDWMPMKYLSQAIPPAYAEWIGRQAMEIIR